MIFDRRPANADCRITGIMSGVEVLRQKQGAQNNRAYRNEEGDKYEDVRQNFGEKLFDLEGREGKFPGVRSGGDVQDRQNDLLRIAERQHRRRQNFSPGRKALVLLPNAKPRGKRK